MRSIFKQPLIFEYLKQVTAMLTLNYEIKGLFKEFEQKLIEIQESNTNMILSASEAIALTRAYLQQVRKKLSKQRFKNNEQEIDFFKNIKPLFTTYLFYYTEVYNIEVSRPQGGIEQQERFLKDEYTRIHYFCTVHQDFYKYYKSARSDMDASYFVREQVDKSVTNVVNSEIDSEFSTGYDQLIARFRANDMLSEYINKLTDELHNGKPVNNSAYSWTASQAGLAELVMALDAHATVNHQPIGIGKMAQLVSTAFNVNITNIYKIREEIKMRKRNPTVFLDNLKLSLIRKLESDD
ncbi:MAG: RteC domain-containing protein [Chitinophagaceae bacterium]|nr:RteC domain-containing protein [Chitinophagaceae bacterium]